MRGRLIVFAALFGPAAAAQSVDVAPRVSVSGIVYDSVALAPLAGATVQLVSSRDRASFARTAISDSLGRYTIGGVPSGQYVAGFFHPVLDSLGVSVPAREVRVDRTDVRADLAIPSPKVLRAAICGPAEPDESGAVMVGVVRDARDRAPVEGATVSAEWVELEVNREGITRSVPRVAATTKANGWFALCDVPAEGTIAILASRGADSTDVITLAVPAVGLLRRELYLGSRVAGAGAIRDENATLLSGTVVRAADNRPITGARVSILDGPEVGANEAGEWTLASAPLGTRVLEVRAVGYFAERVVVDVVPGAPPVHARLSTMQAVLDTVRVTASRLDRTGFAQRSQTGPGRYMTQEDIARLRPIVPTDLFKFVRGLHIQRLWNGDVYLGMRDLAGRLCAPVVYLDGHYIRGLGAEDINAMLGPDQIAGIEVYELGTAPAQFSPPPMVECGSIVVWTQPGTPPPTGRWLSRRVLNIVGAVALGLIFVTGLQ